MAGTIKARRVQFSIGDIQMNGYLLPDGRKKLAGRNVTDAVGEEHKSLGRNWGVKSLKALPHADLSLPQIKADSGETFIPVAIEDAVIYWQAMAERGNKKASALMIALATESVERRIDRALGIHVEESERDRQLLDRLNRLQARRNWTDCIKEYQEREGYYLTPKGKSEFKTLTERVNKQLFGRTHFHCDRDTMSPQQQRLIENFEITLSRQSAKHPSLTIVEIVGKTLDLY